MRIGSLFSGCFGMELGLEQSGLGETVWYSEIDKYASAVCRYHKPEIRNYGDATRIDHAELPDTDIIAFGWPLQGLPDNHTKYGLFDNDIREISDTQRCKMIGNAISIPISKLIGQRLKEVIDNEYKESSQ